MCVAGALEGRLAGQLSVPAQSTYVRVRGAVRLGLRLMLNKINKMTHPVTLTVGVRSWWAAVKFHNTAMKVLL